MVSLNISRIQNELNVITVGREIRVYDEVNSTNELAKIYRVEQEGLVFLADSQTCGRGRFGHSWHSPAGLGVYLSVLLKPKVDPEKLSQLALMAGVAVTDSLKPFLARVTPVLKWPNDVFLNGRKLSGILCEYCPAESEEGNALIIGIGVNVNHQMQDFPKDLQSSASSLMIETGSKVERESVMRLLLEHLDYEYHAFLKDGSPALIQKWSERTDLFGKVISLTRQGKLYRGTATHLDDMGRLALKLDDGRTVCFDNGEIPDRY